MNIINFFNKDNKLNILFSIVINIIIFITIFSICSTLLNAAIYKWTDKDNNIQFSDVPPKASQKKPNTETEEMTVNKINFLNNSNKSSNKEFKEKLDQYKQSTEPQNAEDITPFLEELNNKKSDDQNTSDPLAPTNINSSKNKKLLKKYQNCSIAKNNLENLNSIFNKKLIVKDAKSKKIKELSKSECKQEIKLAQKQIDKFCS